MTLAELNMLDRATIALHPAVERPPEMSVIERLKAAARMVA